MTIAVYTDGLFERRTDPIDLQLDRLRASVVADFPEAVATAIMDEMVGTYVVEDDTALLVLRRSA
jgi:hypothetical protein